MLIVESVLKRTEHNHDFGGKIGETGEPDGRECSEPEGKRRQRHRFGQSAHRVEVERGDAFADFAGDAEKKSDRKPVSKHQNGGAGGAKDVGAGDAEENIAHVHDAGITEHPIEASLRDRDQADVDDVGQEKDQQYAGPLSRAIREQRQGQAKQAVKSKFF